MTEQERDELIEKITQNISVACGYRMTPTRRFIVQSHARAAFAVAEPVIRERCARIADQEANAMAEQLDNIIEKGTLGGRRVPDKFKRSFAHERKILMEGYEQIAAAIREGGRDE